MDDKPNIPPETTEKAPAGSPAGEISRADKRLVIAALGLGFLFDRLFFTGNNADIGLFMPLFWLVFLVFFYVWNWSQLKQKKSLHFIAGCTVLLCLWPFIFDYHSSFGILNFVVLPPVLMGLIQISKNKTSLKKPLNIVFNWLQGWFLDPFTKVPQFFGIGLSFFKHKNNEKSKKILIGLCISLPLLLFVLPLLAGADQVFSHYLTLFFTNLKVPDVIAHGILLVIAAMLIYSFLCNTFKGENSRDVSLFPQKYWDKTILTTFLSVILGVYALFCLVQFTYLFAGAELPEGITYSSYAREGFGQLLVVGMINLVLFGLILQYSERNKIITILLLGLLALTMPILISGALRLKLYIDTYGLTWLRLLSGWFMVFVFLVLGLCAYKLARREIPLISVCGFVLLGWYTILGFSNPDRLIVLYNMNFNIDPGKWIEENQSYVAKLSDDALLVLVTKYPEAPIKEIIKKNKERKGKLISKSLASRRLAKILAEH